MENSLPTIIRWWNYNKTFLKNSVDNNKLVRLLTETSNACNLNCQACFVKSWTNGVSQKWQHNEMTESDRIALIIEAHSIWARVIDIVWAWEPTLDPLLIKVIQKTRELSMQIIIFSNWATKFFNSDNITNFRDISFILKLWSLDSEKQNKYVSARFDYATLRNKSLDLLINTWFTEWNKIELNWSEYKTTWVWADILVMKSNLLEIPNIFKFCRDRNIMPMIKTYIPFGNNAPDDECEPDLILKLREKLANIDRDEYWIDLPFDLFYPQVSGCIQNVWWLYVNINWKVYSCVWTTDTENPLVFTPWKDTLNRFLSKNSHNWFWCLPRFENFKNRWLIIPIEEGKILKS